MTDAKTILRNTQQSYRRQQFDNFRLGVRALENQYEELGFTSFQQLVTTPLADGLGMSVKELIDIIGIIGTEDDQVWLREVLKLKPGPKPDSSVDNVNRSSGNSASYTLTRLQRDHPELYERVTGGELSANAAAIEAGFRKKPTPREIILREWKKLSPEEKHGLLEELVEENPS